jgi:hypothetical protein
MSTDAAVPFEHLLLHLGTKDLCRNKMGAYDLFSLRRGSH